MNNRRVAIDILLPDNCLEDDKVNHIDASHARKKLKVDTSVASSKVSSASMLGFITALEVMVLLTIVLYNYKWVH